jgi:GAF domain-containing protein
VNDSSQNFVSDVSAIDSIEAVPTILQVICSATQMGFAAVARVTEGRWVACSVVDRLEVGLRPGVELPVENTIDKEIRRSREGMIVDRVAEEGSGPIRPTLELYGVQSYISMPIILRDGSLFGALCASDRKPRRLNVPGTVGMFKLFAQLIAIQIDSQLNCASNSSPFLAMIFAIHWPRFKVGPNF